MASVFRTLARRVAPAAARAFKKPATVLAKQQVRSKPDYIAIDFLP